MGLFLNISYIFAHPVHFAFIFEGPGVLLELDFLLRNRGAAVLTLKLPAAP